MPAFKAVLLNISDQRRSSMLGAVKPKLESLDSSRFLGAPGHVFSFSGPGWGRQTVALEDEKGIINCMVHLADKSPGNGKGRHIHATSSCLLFLMAKEDHRKAMRGSYVQIFAELRIQTLLCFFWGAIWIVTPWRQFSAYKLQGSFDERVC